MTRSPSEAMGGREGRKRVKTMHWMCPLPEVTFPSVLFCVVFVVMAEGETSVGDIGMVVGMVCCDWCLDDVGWVSECVDSRQHCFFPPHVLLRLTLDGSGLVLNFLFLRSG